MNAQVLEAWRPFLGDRADAVAFDERPPSRGGGTLHPSHGLLPLVAGALLA